MLHTVKIRNSNGQLITRFNTGIEYDFDDLPELIIDEIDYYDFHNPVSSSVEFFTAQIIDSDFDEWEIGISKRGRNFEIDYFENVYERIEE